MKIYYPKKSLLVFLVMGIGWSLLSIYNLYSGYWNIASYGGLASAILGWAGYFYFRFVPYLEMKNGKLTKNSILRKTIAITSETKELKNYTGDIILTTGDKQLTIEGQMLNEQDKMALEQELRHCANAA